MPDGVKWNTLNSTVLARFDDFMTATYFRDIHDNATLLHRQS